LPERKKKMLLLSVLPMVLAVAWSQPVVVEESLWKSDDMSSSMEHRFLATLSESLSWSMMEGAKCKNSQEPWLNTRAWIGNSHIGNRPQQNKYYYELAKLLRPKVVCEIGMNGEYQCLCC